MTTRDLRLAARTLSRSRGFAVTAILSFALAIALNTTIYSLLAALIDPQIDVRKPEQLYSLRFFGDYHHRLPRGALESALSSGVPGLTGVTGTRVAGKAATVEHGRQEFDARVLTVRANLFAVLGTRALEGRVFTEADAAAGAPLAIVSDGLVARLFPDGALPINATIAIEGQPYTVIGVVRRSTVLNELSADAWLLPAGADRTVPVNLIRLAERVDLKSVDAQLHVIAARLAVAAGDKPGEARLRIGGSATRQFRVGKFHWALAAGALAVLLVACSNLANLQLARGLARSSELALRSALGATRRDLVALVMYEVALLAAGGLALGLVLAYWGTRLIRATIPSTIAGYLVAPSVHWQMLGVADCPRRSERDDPESRRHRRAPASPAPVCRDDRGPDRAHAPVALRRGARVPLRLAARAIAIPD